MISYQPLHGEKLFCIGGTSRYTPYHARSSTLACQSFRRARLSQSLATDPYLSPAPVKSAKNPGIVFTKDQRQVIGILEKKVDSMKATPFFSFVSGPAGSGKSVVLRHLAAYTDSRYGEGAAIITAPTGIAAQNVNGATIHSGFAITPMKPFADTKGWTLEKLRESKGNMGVIIIDEVSMVTPTLLAEIDHRARSILCKQEVFGGASVIAFGDLQQLPPVQIEGNAEIGVYDYVPDLLMPLKCTRTPGSPANLWSLFKLHELTTNVRTPDREEAEALEAIRNGTETIQMKNVIHRKCRMVGTTPGAVAEALEDLQNDFPGKSFIILAGTNAEVETLNRMKLASFNGKVDLQPSTKRPETGLTVFPFKGEKITIHLAVGAKAMMTQNVSIAGGMVNGTIGTIRRIEAEKVVMERLDNRQLVQVSRAWFKNRKGESFYQFPLVLAEAITVHKSQGMTFDGVVIVSRSMWRPAMFYTALSRARSMDLCRVTGTTEWLDDEEWRKRWTASQRALLEMRMMRRRQN